MPSEDALTHVKPRESPMPDTIGEWTNVQTVDHGLLRAHLEYHRPGNTGPLVYRATVYTGDGAQYVTAESDRDMASALREAVLTLENPYATHLMSVGNTIATPKGRFHIRRTSTRSTTVPPVPGAYRAAYSSVDPRQPGSTEREDWFIDIDSLDTLLDLTRDQGRIIVEARAWDDTAPTIEVYDDWRE